MGMENIFSCADEMDFAPQANIDASFFANDFEIDEKSLPFVSVNGDQLTNMDSGTPLKNQNLKPNKSSLPANWQKIINRAFMGGMTTTDIMDSIGPEIMALSNAAEILGYIKKYEGLIGTVFVDISVLNDGFPYSRIPKKFEPFHRFAINCTDFKQVKNRNFVGQMSGDIDVFLNASEELEEKSQDTCVKTNLPVYRKGMFTQKVIDDLLHELGEDSGTLFKLQELLKERVLGIRKPKEVDRSVGDFKYSLKPALNVGEIQHTKTLDHFKPDYDGSFETDVVFEDDPKTFEISNEDLSSPDLVVGENALPEEMTDFKMDYTGSVEHDIEFEDGPDDPMKVKLDYEFRF